MTTRPRVLLVDDEAAIRDNLGPFLERSGFEVSLAADGELALEAVATLSPDLVVLDVMMPRLDGREVLRRLRAADHWTPVVLLTQVGESYERAAALEEGADDYLNKPFDPQELVARIRAILRRTAAGVSSLAGTQRLVSGDLSVDRMSRRTWLAGVEVTLTPKAFALLEYLMTHPDEVLSRDRLLASVWGFDFPVTSRAVDHRVAELRRVLDDDSSAPRWLETAQGLGYRFVGRVERA
ncbi:response regulator transcription factor [Glaciihabitans arcticus]|uniref:Response regulator transcription factor n=1 Tax=Glaciihabitans arcticus TaxID=2668039 RepID=A0A4Q9GRD7_9MICO|nr:response regulator transcription factor [Glaciihabitans arcticus]TBN57492.1 response regulator transcription factor [Glaciihabitans arcticus]